MKLKRMFSMLLVLAMVIMILPMTMLSAFAADGAETPTTETRSIMLGTSHITGGQASNIYFGTYQQSSLGNTQPTDGTEGVDWIKSTTAVNNGQGAYYKKEPIKWRVLSNADGKAFLLSDKNLDVTRYHEDPEAVTWETSTIRSWLNGYGAASNTGGESGKDYSNDNFINVAFSENEKNGIAKTDVINATYDGTSGTNPNPSYSTSGGNDTTDKVFLLSIAEAQNTAYGFTNNTDATDTRKAVNTAYVYGGGEKGYSNMYGVGEADYWWLRSPGDATKSAAPVDELGGVYSNGGNVTLCIITVRPAFNLNLSSVLFTSAASGGKPTGTGLTATTAYTGNEYKLTLLDGSRNAFEATLSSIVDNTVTVSYSGAKTGDNEYISAIIKNGDTVKYYGRLGLASESGTATVTLPDDFNAANGDVLCVFNEQHNGDYKTDYASELIEIGYRISFDANGGTGTMSELLLTSSNYTLPKCTLTPPADYGFLGWSDTADGEVINTPTIALTENITLYAKWATYAELIASLDKAVEELNAAVLSNEKDIETINGKIDEINNLINALDNTYATDTAVKEAIATAKSEAITAAETLVNNAKIELNAAIANKADTATVNAAIKELQDAIDALEAVKDNYASADTELKTELESKITSAQTTLNAAIDALSGELDNVKSELDKVKSELVAKDNELAEKDSELVAKDAALEKADADNKAAIEAAMNEADSANKTLGIIGLIIGCVSFVGMATMAVSTFLIKKKQS